MRLILLGPPGVGKGTQAKQLKEYFNIIHLSTGDILRGEIESQSSIGEEAQTFMDAVSYTHLTLPTNREV